MELLKTWWESLGLTKDEAAVVDNAIEATAVKTHPRCENCANTVDPNSVHDCQGIYDEVRVYLKEAVARSTRNRLFKKYNCEYPSAELTAHIEAYRAKDYAAFELKIAEFKKLREDGIYRSKMLDYNWEAEEDLWNS